MQAFIYGDPLGFKVYGEASSYGSYFEGFFVTSRQGKRLHIHRRSNGDTIYSYLHYGLSEYGNRPTNAFFGMTVVVDGFRYATNPAKIFHLFDQFFELISLRPDNTPPEIINDLALFTTQASGRLKYAVPDFEKCSSTMKWLEDRLPQIFSYENALGCYSGDSSFDNPEKGKTALINSEDSPDLMISYFQKFSSIALSPDFPKATKNISGTAPDSPSIPIPPIPSTEIDISGLILRYGEINEEVVNACASLDINHLTKLRDEVQSFRDLLKTSNSSDEVQSRYSNLSKKIGQILESLSSTPQNKKICSKCGKALPLSAFPNGGNVCRECFDNEGTPLWMYAVVSIFILAFISSLAYVWLHNKSTESKEVGPNGNTEIVEGDTISNSQQYATTNSTDEGIDTAALVNSIKSNVDNPTIAMNYIDEKFPPNSVGENSKQIIQQNDYWKTFAKSYKLLSKMLIKSSLAEKDREYAQKIIDSYKKNVDLSDEQKRLNAMSCSDSSFKETPKASETGIKKYTEYTVVYTPSNANDPITSVFTDSIARGVTCKPGSNYKITNASGQVLKSGQTPTENNGEYTFRNNKFAITFTSQLYIRKR